MQGARRRMWIAWAFTGPIVVLMLLEMVFGIHWASMMVMDLVLMALALARAALAGLPHFPLGLERRHARQRQHGRAHRHGHRAPRG